ncbi:MAG: SiaC family regulatory phosphoprotein [Bacteroidales bacterium]|nr:SiaC family regulatory phosphoprotein [Bacteroidales bacterium]
MTFTIAQTRTTPYAEFRDGYLLIKGKSVPFDHPDIYDTIKDRLLVYSENPEKNTQIDFNLSAVNAVSKRYIINTFKLLEDLNAMGTNISVNWYYQQDDEDIQELGEICRMSFNINIELKPM